MPSMALPIVTGLAKEQDISRILELYRELAITTSQIEQIQNPSPDDYRQTFATQSVQSPDMICWLLKTRVRWLVL